MVVDSSHGSLASDTDVDADADADARDAEYDNMDLEMLQEVVPMLKQQLEKSMLDRNYVQLERVSQSCSSRPRL